MPSQSATEKHNQEKKSPQTFTHFVNSSNVSAMFDNHSILLFWMTIEYTNILHILAPWSAFRALFTWSRRTMYYVRKGSWAFYLNYPQINEVGKSDHIVARITEPIYSHARWQFIFRRPCIFMDAEHKLCQSIPIQHTKFCTAKLSFQNQLRGIFFDFCAWSSFYKHFFTIYMSFIFALSTCIMTAFGWYNLYWTHYHKATKLN